MGTYLVTACQRKNFKLWMKTSVKKIIRTRGHATGARWEAFLDSGYSGVVNFTSITHYGAGYCFRWCIGDCEALDEK